jgi:ribosomal protein S18 acetylase RimI-like enzyme
MSAVSFTIRPFQPGDAAAIDDLWRQAFARFQDDFPGAGPSLAFGAARLAATGSAILVAEADPPAVIFGAVRHGDEEGVGWLDLLAATRPFAGRELVREVERRSQARGLRTVRLVIPANGSLEAYFARLGYHEVAVSASGQRTLERRLPLLTVRAQRRTDAAAIAALANVDPWPFEQGVRPGWFVLADGERVAGVVAVRESGLGEAVVHTLALVPAHRGRGLEPWMLTRAASWAVTNGFHTVAVDAALVAQVSERDLEDLGWFPRGGRFVHHDRVRAEGQPPVES